VTNDKKTPTKVGEQECAYHGKEDPKPALALLKSTDYQRCNESGIEDDERKREVGKRYAHILIEFANPAREPNWSEGGEETNGEESAIDRPPKTGRLILFFLSAHLSSADRLRSATPAERASRLF
jgi:hypothetical protein